MTNTSTAQRRYMPGTSRGPRRAATLLAQMADLERGERIKRLRAERHLTQPAVAEMVHVTLRAYQEWEAGGGIQWENVKRLSTLLEVDPEYIMRGERSETPDVLGGSQLDRIEAQLAKNAEAISQLQKDLAEARAETVIRAGEVLARIDEEAQAIRRLLPPPRQAKQA